MILCLYATRVAATETIGLSGAVLTSGMIGIGEQSSSKEIRSDCPSPLVIIVSCGQTPCAATIESPSHTVITAANAATNGVDYQEIISDGGSQFIFPGIGIGINKVFNYGAPEIGNYKTTVTLAAPAVDATAYGISALLSCPLKVGLGTPENRILLGESIALIGLVFEGANPFSGANVTAELSRSEVPPVSAGSVNLLDNGSMADLHVGDGIYSAVITPSSVGEYVALATFTGSNSFGNMFERIGSASFEVSERTSTFSGTFADSKVDDNANGLTDRLRISVGLNIGSAADYDVSLTLLASNGKSIKAGKIAALSVGAGSVDVDFFAADIRTLEVDGPYTVSLAELEELSPVGKRTLRDRVRNALITGLCPLSGLERPGIILTGNSSAEGIDTNGNGKFDILKVDVEADVLRSGFHEWSANLVAPGNKDVGFNAASESFSENGIVDLIFEFSGCKVGEGGTSGPYSVEGFLISGSSGSLVKAGTIANADFKVSDFECATDIDNDGQSNQEEQGAGGDNSSFDGNNDGTPDWQQSNVTSLHSQDGRNYVTLALPEGAIFMMVRAVPNPSPNDAPNKETFPYGFYEFVIKGISPGAAISLTMYLPGPAEGFYKWGPTPGNAINHWYSFLFNGTTGSTFAGNTVTLRFVDGARGDDDLNNGNGEITDQGGPSVPVRAVPVASLPGLIGLAGILALGGMLVLRRALQA